MSTTDNREYSPTQGNCLRPDPAGLAAVDPTNPQTWNRYAYVNNNPVSATDPSGLEMCEGDCEGGGGGGWDGYTPPWSGSSYAGGNDIPTSYQVDGVQVSSSLAGSLLHTGSAAICPSNNCTGFRVEQGPGGNTLLKQYGWIDGYVMPYNYDSATGYVLLSQEPGHWGWQTTSIMNGSQSLPPGGDVPVGVDIWHCAGCAATWRNASGATNDKQLRAWAKAYFCGSSPANNIRNWTLEGGGKGFAFGVISGAVTGTVLGTPVGGFFGAIVGGVTEGTFTAGAGVFGGAAASVVCSSVGMY